MNLGQVIRPFQHGFLIGHILAHEFCLGLGGRLHLGLELFQFIGG